MPITNYNSLSFTDIVFEGRNKSYGAYELRNSYNQTMGKALVRAVVIFALLFAVPIGINKLVSYFFPAVKITLVDVGPSILNDVQDQPYMPEPPKPEQQPQQSGGKTVKSGLIVVSSTGVDTLPKVDSSATFGGTTGGSGPGTGGTDNKPGTGTEFPTGGGNGEDGKPQEEITETVVEIMPEFPGGTEAMITFLAKRITYTSQALNSEREGKVYIQFIVNRDGSLSNFEVVRGIGYGLDEKALDAAKQMPNWTPGRNGNHTAKVRCVIPVEFRLNK